MPWENRSVMKMREEFVKRVLAEEKSISALCREYGISRPTGYKWIERYREGQELIDRSRRPNAIRYIQAETEQMIVTYRQEHPAIGALKIRRILENKGYTELPCVKTINSILKRNGMISKEASQAAMPFKRFEKEYANELWQADFKGHFTMTNGERCHPLNILDDHSRFNLCCEPMQTESFKEIKPVLIRVFEAYGMPKMLLCDNGNPWGTSQSTGYTKFEVWMMELGILTIHGRPLHPQTQGKEERFNNSMKKELLNHTTITDQEDARMKFSAYRQFYNAERPHRALNMDTPAQHYQRSEREYTAQIPVWEYPEGCELRRIKGTGFLTWKGQGYFLSEALAGKEIALKKSQEQGCYKLLFRQFQIGRIDVEKRVFTSKRAYLIEGDPRSDG